MGYVNIPAGSGLACRIRRLRRVDEVIPEPPRRARLPNNVISAANVSPAG